MKHLQIIKGYVKYKFTLAPVEFLFSLITAICKDPLSQYCSIEYNMMILCLSIVGPL